MSKRTQEMGTSSILEPSPKTTKRRKPRKKTSSDDKRLLAPEVETAPPLFKPKPRLEIRSAPLEERVRSQQNAYVLVVQPYGVRACGGLYSAQEGYEILKVTRRWDWSLDANQRPRCLPRLEALLDQICRRSFSIQHTENSVNKILNGGEL